MQKLIEAEWSKRSKKLRPQDYFDWPATDAPGGDRFLFLQGVPQQGMLGFPGYHVGRECGIPGCARQELLCRIFVMQLPPVVSPAYVAEWGAPESSMRLRKMASRLRPSHAISSVEKNLNSKKLYLTGNRTCGSSTASYTLANLDLVGRKRRASCTLNQSPKIPAPPA